MPPFATRWRFKPRKGKVRAFQAAYGENGPWVKLLRKAPGYDGTTLRRLDGPEGNVLFEVEDRWVSAAAYRRFRRDHAQAYARIDKECEALNDEEVQVLPRSEAVHPPRGPRIPARRRRGGPTLARSGLRSGRMNGV